MVSFSVLMIKRSFSPSSGKSMLVPLPSIMGARWFSLSTAHMRERLITSSGTASARTGPPILNEEWTFIGSFSRSVSPGIFSLSSLMAFSRFSMMFS